MQEIFLIAKNYSIFESLEELGKKSKKFKLIKSRSKIDNPRNENIYIIDDNILKINDILNLTKKNQSNLILLQKKKNIEHHKLLSIKVFYKPIKIFDLYNEITNKIEAKLLKTNNWILDKKKMALISSHNETISLTEKEISLLTILIKNTNKSMLKKDLLKSVWKIDLNKNIEIETRVLETSISRIRKKLAMYKHAPNIKKQKTGYKIIF